MNPALPALRELAAIGEVALDAYIVLARAVYRVVETGADPETLIDALQETAVMLTWAVS